MSLQRVLPSRDARRVHELAPLNQAFYSFKRGRHPATLHGMPFINPIGKEYFDSKAVTEWQNSAFGDTPPPFVPGLQLCEQFYREAVRPIIERHFPGLRYSAARMDYGSDVFGFDTELSRDHAWAPQVTLYLEAQDLAALREQIDSRLQAELPRIFKGYSTMGTVEHIWRMHAEPLDTDHHKVRLESLDSFFLPDLLGSPTRQLTAADWLSITAQKLRVYSSGKVFHDGLQSLSPLKERLAWYPEDVWLQIMAVQWERIGEREAFPGRCVHVGDLQGAAWNVDWITRELATICFLMERQYPPYSKWFGTAFSGLKAAATMVPIFQEINRATEWPKIEELLCQAYSAVATFHNALGVTSQVDTATQLYFQRPYRVLFCGRFAEALRSSIRSEEVRKLSRGYGAVWQASDSDILLCDRRFLEAYRATLLAKISERT